MIFEGRCCVKGFGFVAILYEWISDAHDDED
jgi:hypothetical protein